MRGGALAGRLVWTLFEDPGELVCTMSPTLRIATDDGADIGVDGRGFAVRDRSEDREWRVAATLRFRTEDSNYAWLDRALGLWEGEFDATRGCARYRAYLQGRPEGATMTTISTTDALTAASIWPERRGRQRLRALSDAERRIYRDILRRLWEGSPPARGDVVAAAERAGLDAVATLNRFDAEDLVHFDGATSEILVAYPFSGRPTAHRVRIDGREVYAMCAIDALGMAPMFGEKIAIGSRDPLTGEDIAVELAPHGLGSWRPRESVVVSGTTGRGESCDCCCPVLNFFASRENAERWLATQPAVRGTVISMDDAIAAGRAVFGDVLEGEEI